MPKFLCITVRWISDRFNGSTDVGAASEWPPSPFRLFQALVAGACRCGLDPAKNSAVAWIETQRTPPEILASPRPATGVLFDHWVPDNDNLLDHRRRSVRRFCPTLLCSAPIVRYIWRVEPGDAPPMGDLDTLTSSLSSLGWAVDQAFATVALSSGEDLDPAVSDPNRLARFTPLRTTTSAAGSLRVPKRGSLQDLRKVHETNCAAARTQGERRRKSWAREFDRVVYSCPEQLIGRPCAIFRLVDGNGDAFRYPHAMLCHIAGVVRHAAIEKMKTDAPPKRKGDANWLETFVCGHRGDSKEAHRQLSYVPLPSIGHEHSDAMIRNVMIVAPFDAEDDFEYLAERLDGEELSPEAAIEYCDPHSKTAGTSRIFLERFRPPARNFVNRCYLGRSDTWQTVTPVILDGYNRNSKSDKSEVVAERTRSLIQRALARAGVEVPCEFDWQAIPFYRNTLSAHKYDRNGRHTGYHRPAHLKDRTAVHVRIRFGRREDPDNMESRWIPADAPIPGPLTIGAGRHCGFGLFAAVD